MVGRSFYVASLVAAMTMCCGSEVQAKKHTTLSKSFGNFTALCTSDDMSDVTDCSVVGRAEAVHVGVETGTISLNGTPAVTPYGTEGASLIVDAHISGSTAESDFGSLIRVDSLPVETVHPETEEGLYDPNTNTTLYAYLTGDKVSEEALTGKTLKVELRLTSGDSIEATFDLSGYAQAIAELRRHR
jgi:hypothetical protein